MKLYTYYSDSHKVLFDDWFMPSVPKSFEVISKYCPQECPSGDFHSDGWLFTMRRKIDMLLQAIADNKGQPFVFADADIQFFGDFHDDILERLQADPNADAVNMSDGMHCTGLFCAWGNQRNAKLWTNVLHQLEKHRCDQLAFNWLVNNYPTEFKINKLPEWEYFNYRCFFGEDIVWEGNETTLINLLHQNKSKLDNCWLHHANYTIGVANKIRMMEIVKHAKSS